MATREQLIDALRRADAAGDEAAARAIARRIKETEATDPVPQQAVQPSPAPQQTAARPQQATSASQNLIATGGAGAPPADPRMSEAMGGGRLQRLVVQGGMVGAADVGDAIINTPNRIWNLLGLIPGAAITAAGRPDLAYQPAPDMPLLRNLVTKREQLSPQTTGERYAETIGNVVGGTVAGGGINPSAPLRSLVTAGGAGAGMQVAQEMAPDNALAGLAGAVGGAYLGGKVANAPGQLARIMQASRGALPASAESEIVQLGRQRNVPVKTSDVFPPKTKAGKLTQDTGESVPVVGSGGRVAQQGARQKAVQDLLDEYGVAPGQDFRPAVAEELLKKHNATIARYTGVKEAIKERSQGQVPVNKAVAAIDQEITKNSKVLGDQASGANQLLTDFKSVLQGKDLRTLEEARKWLGQQLDDPNKAGIKDMLGKSKDRVYGALKQDIESHISGTVSKPAAESWRKANDALATGIREAEKTSLGTVLNKAEMTPEAVKQMISSLNPSDVARLNVNLTSQGRAAARSAVVQKAFDAAFREGKFSDDAFNTALGKELKTSSAFFNSAQMAQAQGLRKLLTATARASKVGLLPETGAKLSIPAALVGLSNLLGGSTVAGIGAYGTIGALSRAYESEPVRNFLIRLSKLPPQEVERQAQKAIPAIVAAQEQE